MKNKELVIDTRMINSSGIGVYLKNVLPGLVSEFDVILLGNKNDLANFSWSKGLKIIEFNAKIYSLKEQLLYPFLIPRTTLFWCPHFNAPMLPIRAKKIVTTIYDVNHLANKKKGSFIKWFYAKMLYNSAVKRSNKIITISEFSKKELLKYTVAKENKISLIYCGVDYDFFTKKIENSLRDIPKKYILYVGNVKPHKNLITLLKAYKNINEKRRKEFKLVILGKKDGFITPDLDVFHFIKENNLMKHIHFTGYLKDEYVPLLYQKASLFVFPSLYEGFGLPILEAMASAVPVLSSNSTSLPEVGGNAVIYFDPMDYVDLSRKIDAFLGEESLREKYVQRGIKQAKQFSWAPAIKKHIIILKQLLREN